VPAAAGTAPCPIGRAPSVAPGKSVRAYGKIRGVSLK